MESFEASGDPPGDPAWSAHVTDPSGRLGRKTSDAKTSTKLGHRRVTNQGTVTYKKTPTSAIQKAIQLGIHHSIGMLQQKPVRDVLFRDFEVVETVDFPKSGTKTTPAHSLSDFRFRTFAPVAFRSFREHFNLDIRDYLNSLCSQELRELSNPGASGSIFYISQDDEFIIKTVQHKEANFLQKYLPEYYMNLVQHPRTLLPKFYGLYCYHSSGKNIRFVVMNNLLPSSIKMHERYDLKGSSYKRKANERELAKESPTLKDLDFRKRHPSGILLEAHTHDALMKTIERDCRVLESFRIMDYSLLLGVHNFDQVERDRQKQQNEQLADNGPLESRLGDIVHRSPRSSSPFNRKSGNKRLTAFSTAMESIEARTEPVEIEPIVSKNGTLFGGVPARSSSGDRLFLYIGIIDILQSYRVAKKMEHTLKSVVADATSVSVTHPRFYAQRFQEALCVIIFRKIPSLDPPQLFGPKAMRFRRLAHLATAANAMKQTSSRRRQLPSKHPIAPRTANHLAFAITPSGGENVPSVTSQCFIPGFSRYSSACSSGYSTMVNNLPWVVDGGEWKTSSSDYPHRTTGARYRPSSSTNSEPRYFKGSREELLWCAQPILSLGVGSEATLSTSECSISSSSCCSNSSINIRSEEALSLLSPDRMITTTKGQRTVGELDAELASVQKLVRRERDRKQKQLAHRTGLSTSSSHPQSLGGNTSALPVSVAPPHYVTMSRRRPVSSTAWPDPVDRRIRPPSAPRGTLLHAPTTTPSPSMTSSVSAAELSTFMRNAEAEFDEQF